MLYLRSFNRFVLIGLALLGLSISTIPIPATAWLFGIGLLGLTGFSKCKVGGQKS